MIVIEQSYLNEHMLYVNTHNSLFYFLLDLYNNIIIMIDTTNLASKPLQDLLRDRTWLLDYAKRLANKLGIDVWTGKWMYKFRTSEIKWHYVFPPDFPDKIGKLLDVLDIYIECKKAWAPVSSTTQENLLFCEFKALEKKVLEHNKK